jgi:Integrase core domain
MKTLITVNTIIVRTLDFQTYTERVLWISPENDLLTLIDINSIDALPFFISKSSLDDLFENQEAEISIEDIWAIAVDEQYLSEKSKRIRDDAWKVIGEIVSSSNEPQIYHRKGRSVFINKVCQEHNSTRRTVYKYLRKFWQRGKVKNGLLPDFENCGGLGKQKTINDKKLGRPKKNSSDPEIGTGVNVDEETKKIFRIALSRFYNTTKKKSLETAYNEMLRAYFKEDFRYEGNKRYSILIPQNQIPTIGQFRYWANKELDPVDSYKSRNGTKDFNLNSRALLSSSSVEVFGPGSKFQIDATIGDVYLVSRFNPAWIIGRPIIYFVIDIFSRMVVGLYVGLEGPSWTGAMMALANTATSKVKYCAEYDITISEKEWDCSHLPEAILADRGEVISKSIDSLIQNLKVRVENTGSFRGDMKGIVERFFRTVQEKVMPFLPGQVIPNANKRTSKDYRLDGKLNIDEFTGIIIRAVLTHNNKTYLENYNRSAVLIANNVPPVPSKLWDWGINNLSGKLSSFPEDIVKLNLLPVDKGRIMGNGIIFKKMRYSCERAIRENWFEKAKMDSTHEVEVTYDLRSTEYIYIKSKNGRDFEKCYLLDPDTRYAQKTIEEVDHLCNYEHYLKQLNEGDKRQSEVDLLTEVDEITESAIKRAAIFQDKSISKAKRVANISGNRRQEKNLLREEQAFELGKKELEITKNKVVSIVSKKPVESDLNLPSHLDLLRNTRKELFGDTEED